MFGIPVGRQCRGLGVGLVSFSCIACLHLKAQTSAYLQGPQANAGEDEKIYGLLQVAGRPVLRLRRDEEDGARPTFP